MKIPNWIKHGIVSRNSGMSQKGLIELVCVAGVIAFILYYELLMRVCEFIGKAGW